MHKQRVLMNYLPHGMIMLLTTDDMLAFPFATIARLYLAKSTSHAFLVSYTSSSRLMPEIADNLCKKHPKKVHTKIDKKNQALVRKCGSLCCRPGYGKLL